MSGPRTQALVDLTLVHASFSEFMICCGSAIASSGAEASAQSTVLFAGHYITPVEWYKASVSQSDRHETFVRPSWDHVNSM